MPPASDSQNRALTWAIPTRETASSRDGLVGQAGVVVDDDGDHRRALGGDPLDVLAHGRLVGQVGLEDQPEGAGVAGDVLEERRPSSPATRCLLSWVDASADAAVVDDRVAGGVEQREVEVELAGEVLVEHRLGDARPARRCRPSRRRGSPGRRRPRARTRAAAHAARGGASARHAAAPRPRRTGWCSRQRPCPARRRCHAAQA